MPTTIEDGIRYSGLETKSMKRMGSSLLLPENATCAVSWDDLPPNPSTLVKYDFGRSNEIVNFPGAKVCMLQCSATTAAAAGSTPAAAVPGETKEPPKILALGGMCRYTKADYKEFKIMMRSKKEGRASGLGSNANYSWPDVMAFQTCPVCAKTCKFNKQYWLVYNMIYQDKGVTGGDRLMVARLQCQLMCRSCFDRLVDENKNFAGTLTSVQDTLAAIPGMPVLLGPSGLHSNISNDDGKKIVSAWALYCKWEGQGIFQALTDRIMHLFHSHEYIRSPAKLAKADATTCLVCAESLSDGQALQCSRCKTATYCSPECQRQDWQRHRISDCVDS